MSLGGAGVVEDSDPGGAERAGVDAVELGWWSRVLEPRGVLPSRWYTSRKAETPIRTTAAAMAPTAVTAGVVRYQGAFRGRDPVGSTGTLAGISATIRSTYWAKSSS